VTPLLEGLHLLELRGIRAIARGEKLRLEGPAGAVDSGLIPKVLPLKAALLDALRHPRAAARAAWEAAMKRIGALWKREAIAARSEGREAIWIDDDPLSEEIRISIKAAVDAPGLSRALKAINDWEAAWSQAIALASNPGPEPSVALPSGCNEVVVTTKPSDSAEIPGFRCGDTREAPSLARISWAEILEGHVLFDVAHDLSKSLSDRLAARQEILRRADALIERSDRCCATEHRGRLIVLQESRDPAH